MGNAWRVPSVLSEKDAWAFATAWSDEIRGCVRLEKDPAYGDFHVVESFEWLTFVFKGRLNDGLRDVEHPPQAAAYARAVTIVWFALSCCKGYSAEENPLFWRRLLTELATPVYPKDDIVLVVNNPYRPQASITDAVGFFSRSKSGFPRVRLVPKLEWESVCIEIFLGRRSVPDLPRDRQLERILAKLKQYIDARLWDRRIEVAIDEVPVSVLCSLASNSAEDKNSQQEQETLKSQHVEMSLHSASVSARDLRYASDANRLQLLRVGFDIVVNPCSVEQLVHARKLIDYISASTTPASVSSPHSSRLRFPLVKLSEPLGSSSIETEVLCSALPHLQAVTTVQATTQQYPRATHSHADASDVDWAWLGYAIFHPESTSAFANVDINLSSTAFESVYKLAAMATGNNLHYAMSGDETHMSTAYHKAQIREMAKVRAQDNERARVVYQVHEESWLDVCVYSADVFALEEYTRVVIPGVGLGWILSVDIIQMVSRPAGESSLRGLRVATGTRRLLDETDGLYCLLSAIGSKLTYLEVLDFRPLLPSDVHVILSLCPALTSLRIRHDGSYWTATDSITDTNQPLRVPLEELELRVDNLGLQNTMLQPLDTSNLPNLKVLRIKTMAPNTLESSHPVVLSILELHESLRYFHWCGSQRTRDAWWPLSHDERRKKSLAFRDTLTKGVHDVTRAPLSLECSLAFLSVVRSKGSHEHPTALGLLGQDIVRHITSFVSSARPRVIWITD